MNELKISDLTKEQQQQIIEFAEKLRKENRTYGNYILPKIPNLGIDVRFQYSHEQEIDQLIAIQDLRNTATVLNGDWKADWNYEGQGKYTIYWHVEHGFGVADYLLCNYGNICFKSRETALEAIEILGEDVVKTALGVK